MNRLSLTPKAAQRPSSTGCWFVIVFVVIAIGLLMFWRGHQANVGTKVAALELAPLTGPSQTVTLDDLKGKVVLVNFFATSCGPCHAELPHVADLHDEFDSNQNFVLLAVSCGDENLDRLHADTKELLARMNLDLPTYADPERVTRDAFGQRGVPNTFLLDREGVIRNAWRGYGPGMEQEMRTAIKQLLNQ